MVVVVVVGDCSPFARSCPSPGFWVRPFHPHTLYVTTKASHPPRHTQRQFSAHPPRHTQSQHSSGSRPEPAMNTLNVTPKASTEHFLAGRNHVGERFLN